KKSLREFLNGSWQPDYEKWLEKMREEYPLPPTEDEKKAIEERIDDEARAYQARWEKEHGRPWPAPDNRQKAARTRRLGLAGRKAAATRRRRAAGKKAAKTRTRRAAARKAAATRK